MGVPTVDTGEVVTQAIEAVGTIAAAYASYKMLEVAKDNYNLWKEQRDYYFNTFQIRVEVPLAAEVFAVPVKALDYSAQVATIYDTQTGALGGQAGDIGGWWDRHAAMYNTVRGPITELVPDIARLQTDWANYLFRYEEHTTDMMNDIRWERRIAVHNIGIKQATAISAALATSFNAYENAIDGVGDQFATLANGAAAYSGYKKGISDERDNFAHFGYRQNESRPVVPNFVQLPQYQQPLPAKEYRG